VINPTCSWGVRSLQGLWGVLKNWVLLPTFKSPHALSERTKRTQKQNNCQTCSHSHRKWHRQALQDQPGGVWETGLCGDGWGWLDQQGVCKLSKEVSSGLDTKGVHVEYPTGRAPLSQVLFSEFIFEHPLRKLTVAVMEDGQVYSISLQNDNDWHANCYLKVDGQSVQSLCCRLRVKKNVDGNISSGSLFAVCD